MSRYVVTVTRPCKDCHGTGERRPSRAHMGHEVRDCETCGRSGVERVSRREFDALGTARGAVIARLTTAGAAESELKGLHSMDAEGGSFRLPDGSTVSVERVEDGAR